MKDAQHIKILKDLENTGHQEIFNAFDLDSDILINTLIKENLLEKVLHRVIIERERCKSKFCGSYEEWKEMMWGDRIEELFISKKSSLDSISFWQAVCSDKNSAMELYFSLCNKETEFTNLKSKNIPVKYFENRKLGEINSSLQQLLLTSKKNIPRKPIRHQKGFVIYQLVNIKQSQLTSDLRKELLNELEHQWCNREINRILETASLQQSIN